MEIFTDSGCSGSQYALPSLYPDEPAVQISGAKPKLIKVWCKKQSKF